jgi:hypothetical protein
MRDYGKVHTSFWTSETTRSLSEDGRALALYLLTSPHSTIAGVFRLPDGYVCEDMQWAPERVAEGFRNLELKGFANRCETSKWVWIRKFIEWNPPENPNQRKGAIKAAMLAPKDCCWLPDFMRDCGDLLGIKQEEKSNPSATLPKPFLNQEPEPEQELCAPQAAPPKTPDAPSKTGSRLPENWTLPDDWRGWAVEARPDLDAETVADSFRDFWISKPGKDGRKVDWQATWRNWVRNQKAQNAHAFRSTNSAFAGAI